MSLPVKKIYVDSKWKTSDSASHSDFKFELDTSLNLPNNTVILKLYMNIKIKIKVS